jgi:hypothetical protein
MNDEKLLNLTEDEFERVLKRAFDEVKRETQEFLAYGKDWDDLAEFQEGIRNQLYSIVAIKLLFETKKSMLLMTMEDGEKNG